MYKRQGEYGVTVRPFNEEVRKKVIGDKQTITCRPADLLEPELPKLEAELGEWKEQDEDILSYALLDVYKRQNGRIPEN